MLTQAIVFLADAIVGFFCFLFLLRFYMQAFRVSFGNPFGHFAVALTNWAVKPLRRVVPGMFGLDMASLLMALVLQLALIALILALGGGLFVLDGPTVALMMVWGAVRGVLRLSIYILIGALILQAVLSWVNPYSPLSGPANQLTRPFLSPIQRILPPISGIDLSPLVAILLAQVVLMFL
jgi:YggT family protein